MSVSKGGSPLWFSRKYSLARPVSAVRQVFAYVICSYCQHQRIAAGADQGNQLSAIEGRMVKVIIGGCPIICEQRSGLTSRPCRWTPRRPGVRSPSRSRPTHARQSKRDVHSLLQRHIRRRSYTAFKVSSASALWRTSDCLTHVRPSNRSCSSDFK
jgi:hypothetical protein